MSDKRLELVQPDHFAPPRGYSNGAITEGRLLHVGGQIGWEPETCTWAATTLAEQFARALDNVLDVVRSAGGEPTDVARMTVYVTDLDAYRASARALGAAWRERFGRHYPAMALLGVAGLVDPRARVEIEAVAVLAPTRGEETPR